MQVILYSNVGQTFFKATFDNADLLYFMLFYLFKHCKTLILEENKYTCQSWLIQIKRIQKCNSVSAHINGMNQLYYSVFQGFSKAKSANGGSILSLSQFLILPQLPQKMKLASKVVKNDSKIIISLPKI